MLLWVSRYTSVTSSHTYVRPDVQGEHTGYLVLSYRFVSGAFTDILNELVAFLFIVSCGHFTDQYSK